MVKEIFGEKVTNIWYNAILGRGTMLSVLDRSTNVFVELNPRGVPLRKKVAKIMLTCVGFFIFPENP